jgi:hypothetical protein
MKKKGKVLLDTKKKSRGHVATLSSRASPFVVCLWHFLSALVPRKRFLERVGVGLNLQISSMTKEGFEGLEGGGR